MEKLKLCFYSPKQRFKRGTILGHAADHLAARGHTVVFDDNEVEPDAYIFEKFWSDTRYRKPVVMHGENLIGKEALEHCHDRGEAMVFNSEWCRRVYRNSFGSEMDNIHIIPPAHQMDEKLERHPAPVKDEQHIVCITKWWKRPFKRFPLIAMAVDKLNRELGYPNAKLHVHGWLLDNPMPYYDIGLKLWKLPERVRKNPNIIYYQKSFHNDTYKELMSTAHILAHPSTIDTGPQVVVEALSQNVPVVITNNMGGAEYVRDVGPAAGEILEIDKITDDYRSIHKLLPEVYVNVDPPTDFASRMKRYARMLYHYPYYAKLCTGAHHVDALANALKKVLDNYDQYRFECPRKYTMEGIADQWEAAIRSAIERFEPEQG